MAEKEFVTQDLKGKNKDDTAGANATIKRKRSGKKSSFPGKIVDACHVVEVDGDRSPKTRIGWLKDPRLYAV